MDYKKLTDFKLNAYYPYVPLLKNSNETGEKLECIFNWMNAEVPGCIYNDLINAKVIRDPYFEMQSLEAEWVADRWWEYQTSFFVDKSLEVRNIRLRLKGIDYKAHISLNGTKLGEHEGMNLPFVYNITDILKKDDNNLLSVVLENAPDEMGQVGYTEETTTNKARFTYKWDFCTRLVHIGLYDDVLIEHFGNAAINYSYIRPVFDNGKWTLQNSFEVEAFKDADIDIELKLVYNDKTVAFDKKHFSVNKGMNNIGHDLLVDNPKLWYPNGHGDQPMYKLIVSVKDENGLSDSCEYKTAFRTLNFVQCDNCEEGSLPYNVVINGKRIYIKGVNLTPLDIMYGSVSDSTYEKTLKAIKDANINLIRVWGGGIIEKEILYNLCDDFGIMVWQEFIQSSSGINNTPSKRPEFLELAKKTALEAVKVKRNHVSLTFWGGGNELMKVNYIPAGYDDENIAELRKIAEEYDSDRLMLPTSPSGPLEFLDINQPKKNHDVHGPWKYYGTEVHYKTFNKSDSQLHSEFGVEGMTNYEALVKFTSPKNRQVKPMLENIVWRHHGEWWDTFYRDTHIFGKFKRRQIKDFIICSQFIQAEGIRYALEANRRRAFQNCGSIIWQFNEPWPNVSATNVMDYYQNPKLAYHFMKAAYSVTTPNLKYDKLLYSKDEIFRGQLYVNNDSEEYSELIKLTVRTDGGEILLEKKFHSVVSCNSSTYIADIEFNMIASRHITVTLELINKKISNEYIFFITDKKGKADKTSVIEFYEWYNKNRASV